MLSNFPHLNRRHFLKHVAGSAAMVAGGSQFINNVMAAGTQKKMDKKKGVIVLWMAGGPSHMDLWDIKSGSPNQGSFEAAKTTANGIEISEAMPKVAEQFKHMSVIRSLNSKNGDHRGGTVTMLTGRPPDTLGVGIPHFGSLVSYYNGNSDAPLQFISIGGTALSIGSGYLGAGKAPFQVQNAGTTPENIKMPQMGDARLSQARGFRRKDILTALENNFKFGVVPHKTGKDRAEFDDASKQHAELTEKALDISLRAGSKMFEFDSADQQKLAKFGNSGFGRGCLLAVKLRKAGVTAIEIDLGGWDMHGNIADGIKRNGTGTLDPGMGNMIELLNAEGLLKDTLVVWMGDFGRTPRINQGGGRDHWPNPWSIVLGGAGIKPGVEYGKTDADGISVKDKPVSVGDLYATMYRALGIDIYDLGQQPHDRIGRRDYIAPDQTGKANAPYIKELVS